jgi:hypothetical protein
MFGEIVLLTCDFYRYGFLQFGHQYNKKWIGSAANGKTILTLVASISASCLLTDLTTPDFAALSDPRISPAGNTRLFFVGLVLRHF